MSTLKVLKEYLVGDGGYLLKDDNNGKTVMLSGAWGSGKTHFWQNGIEEDLTKELNKKSKACIYVSLYGKDNIEAIKNEILFKAYESIKDENQLAKRAISAFGFGSRLLSVSVGGVRANTGVAGDAVEGFFESKKIDEAESFLADGGLICLDDFERKSKHIDLNDLFGFIAQLAIDMNCKVVIILNSDVFEGEEANVFKIVKEKTVNKFFYFKPSIEELFESIYGSDDKYKRLNNYKSKILHAIKKTEELNARIYIQVLDNCLEWIDKGYDDKGLVAVSLTTIYFIKTHSLLSYAYISYDNYDEEQQYFNIIYSSTDEYSLKLFQFIKSISNHGEINYEEEEGVYNIKEDDYKNILYNWDCTDFFDKLDKNIHRSNGKGGYALSETEQKYYLDFVKKYENKLCEFWKYGYRLYYMDTIDEETYENIANFVKSGILSKKEDIL
jgi:hypothetical protein